MGLQLVSSSNKKNLSDEQSVLKSFDFAAKELGAHLIYSNACSQYANTLGGSHEHDGWVME